MILKLYLVGCAYPNLNTSRDPLHAHASSHPSPRTPPRLAVLLSMARPPRSPAPCELYLLLLYRGSCLERWQRPGRTQGPQAGGRRSGWGRSIGPGRQRSGRGRCVGPRRQQPGRGRCVSPRRQFGAGWGRNVGSRRQFGAGRQHRRLAGRTGRYVTLHMQPPLRREPILRTADALVPVQPGLRHAAGSVRRCARRRSHDTHPGRGLPEVERRSPANDPRPLSIQRCGL
jgi:hypothetical protein